MVHKWGMNVLQMRMIHISVLDRLDIKVDDNITVFQEDRRMIIESAMCPSVFSDIGSGSDNV